MSNRSDLNHFWSIPLDGLLRQLDTTSQGLSTQEAERRLREFGPNSLVRERRFAVLLQFLRFFANPLVIILLVASAISFALGERINASIIIAMVLLSVLLNFYQEFQASHAAEELRKQVASTASVFRDGEEQELPITDLVPGDIVKAWFYKRHSLM